MRMIACIPLLMVAACGGGGAEQNEAAPKAQAISPGQWELVSEVTAFRTVDEGAPKIDTPVGTRATESVCVPEGQTRPVLFSGDGYRCNYDNYYVRNGRINTTMQCARDDLNGTVAMTADGSFEAESIEYNRELRTVLATDGDVQITARVTGRRTGECTAEAEGDNQSNGQGG